MTPLKPSVTSVTVMERLVVVFPPPFVAVTRYTATGLTAVGVPVMLPVELFRLRPAGSAGATESEATAPPVADGVLAVIAVLLV